MYIYIYMRARVIYTNIIDKGKRHGRKKGYQAHLVFRNFKNLTGIHQQNRSTRIRIILIVEHFAYEMMEEAAPFSILPKEPFQIL